MSFKLLIFVARGTIEAIDKMYYNRFELKCVIIINNLGGA